MNKSLAQNMKKRSHEFKAGLKQSYEKVYDIGKNLLSGQQLTSTNIEELGLLFAAKYKYDKYQLIICNLVGLSEQLDSHKNDDIDQQPIFIICGNDDSFSATFCVVKHLEAIVCLTKDFSGNQIAKSIGDIVKKCFCESINFKTYSTRTNAENKNNQYILCLKALETMMVHMEANKKKNFIENFENPKETYFEWLKHGTVNLKTQLFSFVKEGYYSTIAYDIDVLSQNTEFKKAIKEFINNIPLPKDVKRFKNYQTLLKEFIEIEENENNIGTEERNKMEQQLQEARRDAFSKVKDVNQLSSDKQADRQLDIVKRFPTQMDKFTRIFEPLVLCKKDTNLDKELEEISEKLDLEYEKLEIFFEKKEEATPVDENTTSNIRKIYEVIAMLPDFVSSTNQINADKSFEQLLSEVIVNNLKALNIESFIRDYVVNINQMNTNKSFEPLLSEIIANDLKTLNIESLILGYVNIKSHSKLWDKEEALTMALKINQWAVSKQGKLADSEIYEAIAVLDRANELVTGGHRLRDTQILSVLTFLQHKDKGQLTQIQTGEGKTTIVSILAAIKALKGEKVDVITSNPVLAADAVKEKQLFYNLLNLSVSTNNLDENYKSGPRMCYKADIVYGTISNFQFDYLKDSFLGLSTCDDRPFECVILDEVDSMIIDNASHIAKLSEQLPGMENLKYIYIKIWQELHKAEEEIIREFGKQLQMKTQELQNLLLPEDECQILREKFQVELKKSIRQRIKDSIKQVDPTKIDIIPSHIQEYADNSLDRLINSALDAKFIYHEDEQYVIRMKNDEKVIQPVDYANTGIILKNTIWQYGLHQFLQLKHNLHLTSENLTSCFMSNLSYINKYGNQIFGLTGTLGSEAEQGLLSSIYNVGYAKIPTYKEKKFIEIEGEVVDDERFSSKIADGVISKVNSGRAVLIICETIKDAKAIQEVLKKSNITTKMFLDEENADITKKEVDSGDVVIATNIAGRGTDFKTSAELESNKGLHVCVAFLPCNKRVEDQAFGRTARQGNHGTGQLVIKQSEVDELDADSNCMEKIKNVRDQREKERIELIQKIKIPELEFQDNLFELFSALYIKLKKDFGDKREYKFVLDDLKEFWAFWLNKQNFEGLAIIEKTVEDEFRKFELEADKAINGKIQFNSYYSIQQAEYFISSNGQLDEAEQSLKRAFEISNNSEILHSAYFKLFEIAIERGRVFRDKCQKALGNVFLIPKIEPDRNYQKVAIEYLELAIKAIKKEFDYIKQLFENKEFLNTLRSDINDETTEASPNQPQNENLFVKHLISKQQALSLIMDHAKKLIKKINDTSAGLSIGCRIPDYFCNLVPLNDNEIKVKDIITNSDWAELAANGINITYALREVHDVCDEIVKAARIQIGAGIATIATGMFFPPALFVTTPIGATMITEGICDVAIELINKNSDGKFHKEAFIKSKVISYSISLLTIGINVALQCPIILEKAKNACRWIAETLRKCPLFTEACEALAVNFDKLADWFEKMETIAKFNCMTKIEQLRYIEDLKRSEGLINLQHLESRYQDLLKELCERGVLRDSTHLEKCVLSLKEVSVSVIKNVTTRLSNVEDVMMNKIINSSMEEPVVEKNGFVRKQTNMNKSKDRFTEIFQNNVTEFIQTIAYKFFKQLCKDTFNSTIIIIIFVIFCLWFIIW